MFSVKHNNYICNGKRYYVTKKNHHLWKTFSSKTHCHSIYGMPQQRTEIMTSKRVTGHKVVAGKSKRRVSKQNFTTGYTIDYSGICNSILYSGGHDDDNDDDKFHNHRIVMVMIIIMSLAIKQKFNFVPRPSLTSL